MRAPCALASLLAAAVASAAAWMEVPFVRQEREGCGSAAASMVMLYWRARGAAVDIDAADAGVIQRALHAPDAKGIHGSSLRQYFARHGFTAFVVNAGWKDLEQHVERGRPLIACLEPRRGALHYVVVVGIDAQRDEIVIHDPGRGGFLRHKGPDFRRMWDATGRWTLLAVPTSAP